MTRVKICGLTRMEDVEACIEAGADALGFVFEPASPRCIADRQDLVDGLRRLAPFRPRLVAVYGVCRDTPPNPFGLVQAARFEADPPRQRILAVRPEPYLNWMQLEDEVERVRPAGVLVDAYDPAQYGGTGRSVDLGFADEVRRRLGLPLILAGGLRPETVAEAVRACRPYAVDVSSGVEIEPGVKDHGAVRELVRAAREA